MGTGGNNKKYKIHQHVADMINSAFRVVDIEFGKPGDRVDRLCNTQVAGVYIMPYDKENDIEIEIRVKPKKRIPYEHASKEFAKDMENLAQETLGRTQPTKFHNK